MMLWMLRRALVPTLSLALLLGAAPGCGPEEEEDVFAGDEVRSDKQRVASPQVAAGDMTKQVAGDTAFALDVYQQVRGKPGNLFYSPHSISICLAMLHAGARGNTEAQMAKALQYVLPQATLHPFFNKLDLELASRGQGKKAADGKAFRLNIVNATWGQKGYSFLAPYLDTLALNYGAGLRVLDFAASPEGSRKVINDWVEKETEQRIKDLLPAGSIDSLTRLVLSNAIYFNAAWLKPFEEKDTKKEAFNLDGGGTITVPTMHGKLDQSSYAKGAGYEAVTLPYDGDELSMVVIVPDKGTLATFEKGLNATALKGILDKMKMAKVNLSLPKFKVEHELDLKKVLKALGMTDAFGMGADLSGINGKKDLFVTGAFHKAFVKVNEAGTEAAAATAVVSGLGSVPEYVSLKVDRPFIFLIRDHATGAVLFVGRVADPGK